jgi:hypothetical protein
MTEKPLSIVDRWPAFRDEFFSPPNALDLSKRIPDLDRLLSMVVSLITANPPRPFVLPAVVDKVSYYYGIAFSPEQARSLRELLQSHIGATWSDFDGQCVHGEDLNDPLVVASIGFAGEPGYVYRFKVAAHERNRIRATILSLLASLGSASRRQVRLTVPIGRMIGDLADACAAGARDAADKTYRMLAADHRISETNRLFLQVQVLAAFAQWAELGEHPMLANLLRLERPSRVSDALAQLAMANLPEAPSLEEFQPIGTRFGSLIDSVSVIRTPHGALYYTLWALSAGEPPEALLRRLTAAGWATTAIKAMLATATPRTHLPADTTIQTPTELRTAARSAIDEGRYDTAIELLSALPVDAVDLPAVLNAVTHTFTSTALALLERHRAVHGEDVLRVASASLQTGPATTDAPLAERLRTLFAPTTSAAAIRELTAAIERTGLSELRAPGGVEAACRALRDVTTSGTVSAVATGLDMCIDLTRDLRTSDAGPDAVRSLTRAVLELWAFHDNSGDRRRAARIGQLTSDAVELGVNVQEFDEVVELLRVGWGPYLTDADLPTGLEILERLIAYRPDDTASLDKFAIPMLARIGAHNAARLPPAALAVALDLAPTFGLMIDLPTAEEPEAAAVTAPTGLKIALYSLEETALARATKILRHRHPGLEFVIASDHTASESLKVSARTADLFVIVDRAAKHAATDAIKSERATAPIRYATGKGSTSLIETVEIWLHDQQSEPAQDE